MRLDPADWAGRSVRPWVRLRTAPAAEGNVGLRRSVRCEQRAAPRPVAERSARECDFKVAAVEHAGAVNVPLVTAKRRFTFDAAEFAAPFEAFWPGAHARGEFRGMHGLFVVARDASRSQLEAFVYLFSPESWIEDFHAETDGAGARVVSDGDGAGGLSCLDERRRRNTDARWVVRFGKHDPAKVDGPHSRGSRRSREKRCEARNYSCSRASHRVCIGTT
jgi:hypothetical protein